MMPFQNSRFSNYDGPIRPTPPPYNNQKNAQNSYNNLGGNAYFPNICDRYNYTNYENTYNNKNFDFLGLKIANDDLIILALLFFLYNEKVDDTFLFISLILLLLN